MCGISGVIGVFRGGTDANLSDVQNHRGPDNFGLYQNESEQVLLAHNRLSIIDLSTNANQPFVDNSGRYVIVFNGEVYNYLELKAELKSYAFRTASDTEVVLAAFIAWGPACLHRFIGMFSFLIWDKQTRSAFAARDRFGVKPFFYSCRKNQFAFASEIKTLFQLGVTPEFNESTWATFLSTSMYDHSVDTFWSDIKRLPTGHYLTFDLASGLRVQQWYDLAGILSTRGLDTRRVEDVKEELYALLIDSVKLRFRSDVPVGVLLSGGLDSSLLLGVIRKIFGKNNAIKTFTFFCESEPYDERPWVKKLLGGNLANSFFCELKVDDIPDLTRKVAHHQDEPFGGFPILALSLLHKKAQEEGVKVLLDGNGIDEGWAGYDYYERSESVEITRGPIQAVFNSFSLEGSLVSDFKSAGHRPSFTRFSEHAMANLQARDLMYAKIPRAMRFADRVSMMYSRELREPFLDHRIVELGLRQPDQNKIRDGVRKFLVREVGKNLIDGTVATAKKRPVQTPQREWLRNELSQWVDAHIGTVLDSNLRKWFKEDALVKLWKTYRETDVDNSFPIWQMISISLALEVQARWRTSTVTTAA